MMRFPGHSEWMAFLQSVPTEALEPFSSLLTTSAPSTNGPLLLLSFVDASVASRWIGSPDDLRSAESFSGKLFKQLRHPKFAFRNYPPSYHSYSTSSPHSNSGSSSSTSSTSSGSPSNSPPHSSHAHHAPTSAHASARQPTAVLSSIDPHPAAIQASIEAIIKMSKELPAKMAGLIEECERLRNTSYLYFSPRIITTLTEGLQISMAEMRQTALDFQILSVIIEQLKRAEPLTVVLRPIHHLQSSESNT